MSEHYGSVTVQAPVHQVYTLFSHFNDFPKFMSFVKEVTYLDDQRSHWVAQIAGTQEWDAVNDNWIPDQQIGWYATSGLQNRGLVKFTPIGETQTQVNVYISYDPPAGALGKAVDHLGYDSHFDTVLQKDLQNFVKLVEAAPPGALDPMQSNYLFHRDSAINQGHVTKKQQEAMRDDPMMEEQSLRERESHLQQTQAQAQNAAQQDTNAHQQRQVEQQQAARQMSEALNSQAEQDRRAETTQQTQSDVFDENVTPDPVRDTIGGRNASLAQRPIGDQDGRRERFPGYHEDPMLARNPEALEAQDKNPALAETEMESPWRSNIIGVPSNHEPPDSEDSTKKRKETTHHQQEEQ